MVIFGPVDWTLKHYCSVKKLVSKRRVARMGLLAFPMSCLPCSQQPTHSKVRGKSTYGPQMAVFLIAPCVCEELMRRHPDGINICQDKVRCSVEDNVSK
jgi:hypothetical protein